jgi:AraC-like DNA-binding protein
VATIVSSSEHPFRYAERAPSEAIAPWVLSLWSFQADATLGPTAQYTVWPDGCTSIVVLRRPESPASILCVGPRKAAMHPPVTAGQRVWGVRFWPDAIEPPVGIDARSLRDHLGFAPPEILERFGPLLRELPEGDDADVIFAAFDRSLARLLEGTVLPDARIRQAVHLIVAAKGKVPMTEVARGAALGLRQLQRRFPAATGLTLREYARIRRLREALAQHIDARPRGWSRIAADTGFVDHAHLTREFRALTGLPPTDASEQLARTEHDNVVP